MKPDPILVVESELPALVGRDDVLCDAWEKVKAMHAFGRHVLWLLAKDYPDIEDVTQIAVPICALAENHLAGVRITFTESATGPLVTGTEAWLQEPAPQEPTP